MIVLIVAYVVLAVAGLLGLLQPPWSRGAAATCLAVAVVLLLLLVLRVHLP